MQIVFLVLLPIALAYALWRGGAPERAVALIFLFGTITPLVSSGRFIGVEIGVAVVDTMILAGLVWVVLQYRRMWTLWLAALQTIIVTAHGARVFSGSATPFGYAWIISALADPMLILLIIATWRHDRRHRRSG